MILADGPSRNNQVCGTQRTRTLCLVRFHSLHLDPFIMEPTSDPMDDLPERQHLASRQHGFGTHLSRIGLGLVGSMGRAKNDRCAGGRLAKHFKTLPSCRHEKIVVQNQEMEPCVIQQGDALVGTLHLQDSEPLGGAVFQGGTQGGRLRRPRTNKQDPECDILRFVHRLCDVHIRQRAIPPRCT
jgi:hypothetical protein